MEVVRPALAGYALLSNAPNVTDHVVSRLAVLYLRCFKSACGSCRDWTVLRKKSSR